MMEYLTYDEFISLGGNRDLVNENLFKEVQIPYAEYINSYTFNRVNFNQVNSELVIKFKYCLVELINEFQSPKWTSLDNTQGISSESVGTEKVSYLVSTISDLNSLERSKLKKVNSVIRKYFALTGLMYRGL